MSLIKLAINNAMIMCERNLVVTGVDIAIDMMALISLNRAQRAEFYVNTYIYGFSKLRLENLY